jgi:hypothetical protein
LLALPGCVDAPIRLFEIDASPGMHDDRGLDHDGDGGRESSDDAGLRLDFGNGRDGGPMPDRGLSDEGPADQEPTDQQPSDQDPSDHGPPDLGPDPSCPLGCAVDGTLATYLALDRIDAVALLPGGDIVLGGATEGLDLLDFAAAADIDATIIGGAGILHDGVHPSVPLLVRLSPDLATVRSLEYLNTPAAPFSKLVPLTTDDGFRLYASGQYGADAAGEAPLPDWTGYFITEMSRRDDGSFTLDAWSAVGAAGDIQRTPTWAPRLNGDVFRAYGHALSPHWGAALWSPIEGAAVPVHTWRHHYQIAEQPIPLRIGTPAPPGYFSFLPFNGAVYCPERSWDAIAFAERSLDAMGDARQGRYAFDGYGSGPCTINGASSLAPPMPDMGAHGWRIDYATTFEASDAVVDPATGALYFALNARALRADAIPGADGTYPPGTTDLVPTIIKHNPDGSLAWWQRLHPQIVDGIAVASPAEQRVLALALDLRPGTPGALVVLAQTEIGDSHPLWQQAPGARPGFQQPPPAIDIDEAAQPRVAWLGRFSLDGRLLAATYVFDPRFADATARRPGRLACWTDTDRAADPTPASLRLFRQSLAIGPNGEIALHARGARALTTPDAWQPARPPAMAGGAALELVRVFDPMLEQVLYSSVIEDAIADPTADREVIVEAIAFDAAGRLLVVGRQTDLATSGRLPTVAVPPWGRATPFDAGGDPPPISRAFLLRLAFDPQCGTSD